MNEIKEQAKQDINEILPFIEKINGKTPEQVESMPLPKDAILERVNENRFILDYKHLGIDLDIENGIVVQPDEFMVYTEDEEGDASVFFAMVNPYNLNMWN